MTTNLEWIAPALPRQPFVLRAQGEPIGWLLCEDEAGARAEGELDSRRWTFESTSLPHARITIRGADPSGEFTDGIAAFSNGARYQWRRHHVWGATWCFHREGDRSSVCVEQESDSLQSGGKVSLCCGGGQQPETPILVLLAWYLRVLAFERLVTHADVRLPVF
jgi:hypothetical protein